MLQGLQGENKLIEEKRKLLKQGTKVEFKWYGNKELVYTGRIEVCKFGELYFIAEHNFKKNELISEGMRYNSRLDGFYFFNHFEIIRQEEPIAHQK